MNQLSQEININNDINSISNIIKRNNPNDYINIMHGLTVAGDANIDIEFDINQYAKSKNIDPKKTNFIIAYLGETNNIGGNFDFKINKEKCPKYVDCPKCIDCPKCESNIIFYLIICILIIIIIVIVLLNKK
jgi:hypothetical protein